MDNYNYSSESQCLFLQKWRELLFYKTINSYQFKMRNIYSILKEINEVISDIKTDTISMANIHDLILETKKLLVKDPVVRRYYTDLLGSLSKELKPKVSEKNELLKLEYRVNYALEIIKSSYLENLIDYLEEVITNDELDQIESLTEVLTSQLINTGWSYRSLHRLGTIIFLSKDLPDFQSKWDKFKALIKSEKGLYHCYFEIKVKEKEISNIESADIKLISGQEIIDTFPNTGTNHIKVDGIYIAEQAEAFEEDMYSAIDECKHALSVKQSILSFYGVEAELTNTVLIIFPNEEKLVPFTLLKENLFYQEPNDEDIMKTSYTLKNELIDKEDRQRLLNFFRQYDVSVSALTVETAYTSLWSALESLLVTGHHPSNIEHIKKLVPSVMCSTYIQRNLKNFLYDCNRVGIQPTFEENALNIKDPGIQDIRNLFQILKDESELQNLLSNMNDYSLLKQRCTELSNDLANSESLNKLISSHYNTISMHIQRLYRVRNNLVHAANVEKDIILLIQHLHSYTRVTIIDLVKKLVELNFRSLGQLFMAIEDNHYTLIEVLRENIKDSPKNQIKDYDPELIFSGPIFNYT